MLLSAICALLALSTACSHHHAREAMNQREYASYRGSGEATIAGQVTMTLPDGTVLDGSACQVRLTPITTESKKYIEDVVMAGGTSQLEGGCGLGLVARDGRRGGPLPLRGGPVRRLLLDVPGRLARARHRIDASSASCGPRRRSTASDSVDVAVSR